MEGQGTGGPRSGVSWKKIVESLIKSGEIVLRGDEYISEVEIKPDFGIHVKYDRMFNYLTNTK